VEEQTEKEKLIEVCRMRNPIIVFNKMDREGKTHLTMDEIEQKQLEGRSTKFPIGGI
jgi:peptide subunit release factor RF-3